MKNGKKYNIYFLDYKNTAAHDRYVALAKNYENVYRINLTDTIAETLRILAALSDRSYFWVVSSTTDYSNFKFEDYSEKGLEPYLQVFGAGTWLVSRYHIQLIPTELKYIEEFPNQHFVETNLQSDDTPLDIVYISNGEPYAEKHYLQLINSVKSKNKIHRVSGVNGRTAAYHAAAELSATAWFFAVFAKIEVDANFNWLWHPELIKGPLHYIFNAVNPVNGLEYGHMAVVAYSKTLTLATEYTGLDFIMTKPHDIVPIRSGIAYYNQDPLTTWRTAFREVLKLQQSVNQEDQETQEKIKTWTTVGQGLHGTWSVRGARDALNYYNEVSGDYNQLMLSYDWAWLNRRFQLKYNL